MGFLQPYMANKSREGNLQPDSETENLTQDIELDIEAASEVDNENLQVNIQLQAENVVNESQPQTFSTPTTKSVKKFKKDNVTTLLKECIEKREERAKARTEERKKLVKQLQPTQNDPLFNFFMAMYQSTKKMPPSYQHMIKNRLFNEVSQAEAMLLGIGPSVQQQSIPDQQQPYYQTLNSAPSATPSSSTPSTSTSYYSEHSLLSPSDNHREENDYPTDNSRDEMYNYITTFSDK